MSATTQNDDRKRWSIMHGRQNAFTVVLCLPQKNDVKNETHNSPLAIRYCVCLPVFLLHFYLTFALEDAFLRSVNFILFYLAYAHCWQNWQRIKHHWKIGNMLRNRSSDFDANKRWENGICAFVDNTKHPFSKGLFGL